MNLSNYYEKNVRELIKLCDRPRHEHSYPIKRGDNIIVSITLNIAKNLFRGAELEETSDALLICLDNGQVLALVCLSAQKMGAFATRQGNTYFVAIKFGTIEKILDLSYSIWRDQCFLSHLRHDIKDIDDLVNNFNFSELEQDFYDELKLYNLIQKATFYQCFEKAISFFWLHETAHILGGHLSLFRQSDESLEIIDEFLAVDLDDDESETLIKYPIPYHAMEIEADRWALGKIFGKLHKKFVSTGHFNPLEFITTAIACTLFPLSLHQYKLLKDESYFYDKKTKIKMKDTHPPLWFRADEVIKAEEKAANDQWYNTIGLNKKLEVIRFHQKQLVQLGLAALSQVHPLFGEWLGLVGDLSREEATQRIFNEAYRLVEPWQEDLSCYRCNILPKSKGSV
ncbi:MAG: hypothetical protein O9350_20950 [Microcystis sp. LE19-388.1G]|jgi:hypothetical protein|nr:hypothetical protein [Microcystis sp. LE19-388.1G]